MPPKPRASTEQKATKKVRTGILISYALEQNLRLYCLQKGMHLQDAIALALRELVQKEGMDPDKVPKIQFKY